MTDPFSITASILAVVGAGLKVAKGLRQLANGLGSAGAEVRVYADEIDSFSKLLHRIREYILVEEDSRYERECGLLKDIVDICERVIDPIKRIQESLTPLLPRFRDCPSKFKSFALRIQWMFRSKEKLLFYRGALKGQHRLLDTTLALMALRSYKDQDVLSKDVLQTSLENSVDSIKDSLNASKRILFEETPDAVVSQPVVSVGSVTWGNASKNSSVTLVPSAAVSEGSNEDELDSRVDSPLEGISSIESATAHNKRPRSTCARSLLYDKFSGEQELEDRFDKFAQDIWEDMRVVSRKVLRYVVMTLQENKMDAMALERSTTLQHCCVESQMARDQETCNQLQPQANFGPPPPPSASYQYDPRDFSAQWASSMQRVASKTSHGEASLPAADGFIAIASQESSSSIDIEHNHIPNKTIIFKNADGSLWGLPFREVYDWENMYGFLTELYPRTLPMCLFNEIPLSELYPEVGNAGAVLQAFYRKEYDLIGPQGQVISPQLWRWVIQPGWIIELRFHNQNFNEDLPELGRLETEFYVNLPESERSQVKARLNLEYETARRHLESRKAEGETLRQIDKAAVEVKYGQNGVLRVFKREEVPGP